MIPKRQSKFIKSLNIKKYRAIEKSFLVEGRKNVLELIDSSFEVRCVLATSDFLKKHGHVLTNVGHVFEVTPNELSDCGTFKVNNDCLAVGGYEDRSVDDLDFRKPLFVLDRISDPGNLGTIIRTLDWYGFHQLFCSTDTAEFYNPKVLNTTMGSFTRVKVVYGDIEKLLEICPLPAYGADLGGLPINDWSPDGPLVMVMGSESHGIHSGILNKLKNRITIPRYGQAESLNVGIAMGVFCHHLRSLNSL